MTASRQAAQDVESLIAPILEQEGLQSSVNLIPIPFPFNENMPTGLEKCSYLVHEPVL